MLWGDYRGVIVDVPSWENDAGVLEVEIDLLEGSQVVVAFECQPTGLEESKRLVAHAGRHFWICAHTGNVLEESLKAAMGAPYYQSSKTTPPRQERNTAREPCCQLQRACEARNSSRMSP